MVSFFYYDIHKEMTRGVHNMFNEEKRKDEEISENDEYYASKEEVLKGLEEALKEVELKRKGQLPRKSGRELLKELRDEERRGKIKESYEKVVEKNGGALRRLAKESEEM